MDLPSCAHNLGGVKASTETAGLRDGRRVRIRHVKRADEPRLLAFLESLSEESRRLCFFSPACDLAAAAHSAVSADGTDHIGLVATDGHGAIIGHAAAIRLYGPRAEVAVEVDETHRHLGLASLLLRRLAREAELHGIRRLVAEVLPDNHDMLSAFQDEFRAQTDHSSGEVDLDFPAAAWRSAPVRQA